MFFLGFSALAMPNRARYANNMGGNPTDSSIEIEVWAEVLRLTPPSTGLPEKDGSGPL
jgi:hypothetical protein